METITITVTIETMAKLCKLAYQQNCTVSELVDLFAQEGVNNLVDKTEDVA